MTCLARRPYRWLSDAALVGYWTKGKLDILKDYLDSFTTTIKYKASERLYFDLFAGGPENIYRDSRELFPGSAEIALATGDPPFTSLGE